MSEVEKKDEAAIEVDQNGFGGSWSPDLDSLTLIYDNGPGLKLYEIANWRRDDDSVKDQPPVLRPVPLGTEYYASFGENGWSAFAFTKVFDVQKDCDGFSNEAVIAMLLHRLNTQNGQTPSDANELALSHLRQAQHALTNGSFR